MLLRARPLLLALVVLAVVVAACSDDDDGPTAKGDISRVTESDATALGERPTAGTRSGAPSPEATASTPSSSRSATRRRTPSSSPPKAGR